MQLIWRKILQKTLIIRALDKFWFTNNTIAHHRTAECAMISNIVDLCYTNSYQQPPLKTFSNS